jgi:hypothetical protein
VIWRISSARVHVGSELSPLRTVESFRSLLGPLKVLVLELEAFDLLYVRTSINTAATKRYLHRSTKTETYETCHNYSLFTYGDDICEETTKTGQVLDIGKGDD